MSSAELFVIDPELPGGIPVFKGTRVPARTLFEHLDDNDTLEEFPGCFPTVSRQAARGVLVLSYDAVLAAV